MLYVTTRNNRDAYTAQRVLGEKRAPDGGFYVPMRAPIFTDAELAAMAEKPFGRNVADILNILFGTTLTSWDVDFCIGRYPVRLTALNHRIWAAETWHNPQWEHEALVRNLVRLLSGGKVIDGNWSGIAVRIALLFGIYGELLRQGIDQMDIAVMSGDFSAPISAWYARQWGLPIGNIVVCCNENKSLWDLICHGQLRTDMLSIPTCLPENDVVVPENLERLVYGAGGGKEVEHYLEVCRQGRMYCPGDSTLAALRRGMYVSVVSSSRLPAVISGAFHTSGYAMSLPAGLAYAGLMDYRAKTGETRNAVILSEKSPLQEAAVIASLLDIPETQLPKLVER